MNALSTVGALSFVVALGLVPACGQAFPTEVSGRVLSITITGCEAADGGAADGGVGNGACMGTPDHRLPLTFTDPDTFNVTVQALDQNGDVDPTFTGYVRFSAVPGNVLAASGPNTNGRNVELINGVATNVQVSVVGAYGDARLWVQDLGYVPVNPLGVVQPDGTVKLPECANGIDDNHNGLIDYPADPGCYAANDDTEDGGSYASASSEVIYYVYPRIADVEGVATNGAGTPFPNEQVQINTGWEGSTTATQKGIVVTGVASQGFFVTDIGETRGYASLYAYTYTAPNLMNVCDRLISFGGTAAEFYGFLELNYPTWSLEQWDPVVRPCLVPEPTGLTIATLNSMQEAGILTPLEAGLVRVPAADGSVLSIASEFGPGLIPRLYTCANGKAPSPNTAQGTCADGSTPAFSAIQTPISANPDATSCDYEGTGKIDFSNAEEAACETACEADVECSEYTQYVSNSQFQLVVANQDGTAKASITGDGSASPEFNPYALRGQPLLAFTGNLTYFSGGSQFTIQARCSDDIVMVGGTILPSSPPWPTPDGGVPGPAACVSANPLQTTSN